MSQQYANEQWQLPVHDRLKCNVDASFFNNEGATGWASDSKIVVDTIYIFYCVGSSEFYMLMFYPNFEVKFSKQQANKTTYTLARTTYSWFNLSIFNVINSSLHEQILILEKMS
jgi:hypothetical protein